MHIAANQFFIGAVDVDLVVHHAFARVEAGAFHLAYIDVAIKHGAACTQHFVAMALQAQAQAALADGGNRRQIGQLEGVGVFIAVAGGEGDIGAGNQRIQAGNAALVDARLHNPKLGILAH